jgi:hypothetical protein
MTPEAVMVLGNAKRLGMVITLDEEEYPTWKGRCVVNKERIYASANDIRMLLTIRWTNEVRLNLAWAVFQLAHEKFNGKSIQVLSHQTEEWTQKYQKYFNAFWTAQNVYEFCQAAEQQVNHVQTAYVLWATETPEGAKHAARRLKKDVEEKKGKLSFKLKRKRKKS